MCMRKNLLLAGIALCVLAVNHSQGGELTVKVTEKAPPAEIGESIRKTLQPKAIEVHDGDKPAFEFWFRSDIPLKSKPAAANKALDCIQETALLGAVSVGP